MGPYICVQVLQKFCRGSLGFRCHRVLVYEFMKHKKYSIPDLDNYILFRYIRNGPPFAVGYKMYSEIGQTDHIIKLVKMS